MEFYHHSKTKQGGAKPWEACRHSIAHVPAVHQGVGDALRIAYAPELAALPADIIALLERLR